MQDFFNNLDWMQFLRCFIVGGLICVIGQILIDKTKLTPDVQKCPVFYFYFQEAFYGTNLCWVRYCTCNTL